MKSIGIVIAALSFALMVGCASEGKRVPTDVEAVTTHEFNATDLQIIGKKAVTDLMAKVDAEPAFPKNTRPSLYVASIRNLTDEHIQTSMIHEYLAYELGDTGRFQMIEPTKAQEEIIRQLEFQQTPLVDPATRKEIGKLLGADYFAQGELSNLEARSGRAKGQYFLFTLMLVDIERGTVLRGRVEIQKLSKRGLLGL